MNPHKYNNRQPAKVERSVAAPTDPNAAPAPVTLTPADEVVILLAPRIPRRWLRVAFALAPGAGSARAALAAAWFVTRMRAADKRLRLTINREKSSATESELVLVFTPARGGSLAAEWLEDVKPVVREIASAFEGAELRAIEVISEE
jgi:hypothetical protein